MPKRVVQKKVPVVAYLSPIERTAFHQQAWQRQLTDSEMLRTLIVRFLDKCGEATEAMPQKTAPRPPAAPLFTSPDDFIKGVTDEDL